MGTPIRLTYYGVHLTRIRSGWSFRWLGKRLTYKTLSGAKSAIRRRTNAAQLRDKR